MLDLNMLADRRARALNQQPEGWREAIWSQTFQKLTQHMSDGEVETFVAYSTTVAHFATAVQLIGRRCDETKLSPFAVIEDEAKREGTTPQMWFLKLASGAP